MLKNLTKNQIISKHVIPCKSFWEKSIGLMFSFERKMKGKALIFYFNQEQKVSIHMFFVFYPIDVIWLDENKRVVEQKTLCPFTIYYPKHKAKYVIEADKGILKQTGTAKGDLVNW